MHEQRGWRRDRPAAAVFSSEQQVHHDRQELLLLFSEEFVHTCWVSHMSKKQKRRGCHSSWVFSWEQEASDWRSVSAADRSCSESCSLLGMEFFFGRPLGFVGDSRPPPCRTWGAHVRKCEIHPLSSASLKKISTPVEVRFTIFFHFILLFWYQVFTCSWLRPRDSARSILGWGWWEGGRTANHHSGNLSVFRQIQCKNHQMTS